MTKKNIIIIFFIPLLSYGFTGMRVKDISLYWGQTYRFDKNTYNSFDIVYQNYYRSCTNASYWGLGIRLDAFNNDNYSLNIKYFRPMLLKPNRFMSTYFGLAPVVFTMSKHIGASIKPEVMLRFNSGAFTPGQPISVSLNFSYGYDIPIIEKNEFLPGRHDLNAKVALSYNLLYKKDLLKRKKTIESDTLKAK